MTVHNYRSRQVHKTLNGVNPSSSFRDMRSAKSGPNLWQIWQVFGPWASPYGANGQMTMTVHIYRPRQFHRTSNGENPSSGYRDMSSASLAAARPPARTVMTIPLQPEGLRGKNCLKNAHLELDIIQGQQAKHFQWEIMTCKSNFTVTGSLNFNKVVTHCRDQVCFLPFSLST